VAGGLPVKKTVADRGGQEVKGALLYAHSCGGKSVRRGSKHRHAVNIAVASANGVRRTRQARPGDWRALAQSVGRPCSRGEALSIALDTSGVSEVLRQAANREGVTAAATSSNLYMAGGRAREAGFA
jgi:hypothetical protein